MLDSYSDRYVGFTILIQPKGYWVEYELFEISGYLEDGSPKYGMHFDDNPCKSDFIITGSVKWDGCSNWELSTGTTYHACTRDDLTKLGDLLSHCRDLTVMYCEHADLEEF